MKLTDFDIYKDLLRKQSGLALTPDKSYLLDSRLSAVAKKWGYPSLDAMTVALRAVPDKNLVTDIVEAMTTNETSFFRDNNPFELFKGTVLPYMLEARKIRKSFRIWSAAASSGQEAYSLCMLMKEIESTTLAGWRPEIVGTDISNEILDLAREGIYSQFEVQRGLPIQMLMKYFTQTGDKWQINENLRKMVRFQYFNLLEDMKILGSFDIILCRNVLIYFDEQTKADVLKRMAAQLADDGFLFLGGAETVLGITDAFQAVPGKRGLYAKSKSVHLQGKPGTNSTQALA
jgi:chemotaxis protein methyltransferase CheR